MLFIGLVCLLACIPQSQQAVTKNYTAVVAEFQSLRDTKRNSQRYAEWIWDAAKHYSADIIVFPEGSLTARPQDGAIVPHPKDNIIPYKNSTYDICDPIYVVSEAAAKNRIYVVINLIEHVANNSTSVGYVTYNTNVAFDRNGMVIARYRKYNVYDENVKKPELELSTFTTDFGVTFGMFICFDILFQSPGIDLVRRNVRDIVFSSWWYGELPFLTAAQIQDGWSYAMNANLLAAGANAPESGTTGSGIYVARRSKTSVMYETRQSAMIHGKVPAAGRTEKCLMTTDWSLETRELKLLEDPSIGQSRGAYLDPYGNRFRDRICKNGICCNFDVKYSPVLESTTRYKYRAVAFRGLRRFGANFWHEVAYCAIVLCTDGNCARKPSDGNYPMRFDQIDIDADFEKETFRMPSTLTWRNDPMGMELLETMPYEFFEFETKDAGDETNVAIRLKKSGVGNVITFGIFGRIFNENI